MSDWFRRETYTLTRYYEKVSDPPVHIEFDEHRGHQNLEVDARLVKRVGNDEFEVVDEFHAARLEAGFDLASERWAFGLTLTDWDFDPVENLYPNFEGDGGGIGVGGHVYPPAGEGHR